MRGLVLVRVGGSGMAGDLCSPKSARLVLQFLSPRVKVPQEPKCLLAKENTLELRCLGVEPPPSKYPQHHQNAVIQLHVFLAYAALAVFSSWLAVASAFKGFLLLG